MSNRLYLATNKKESFADTPEGVITNTIVAAYIFCISVFDYHLPYQIMLMLMCFAVFIFVRIHIEKAKLIYVIAYAALTAYFTIHTLMGFSSSMAASIDRLATMAINLLAIIALTCYLNRVGSPIIIIRAIVGAGVFLSAYVILRYRLTIFDSSIWYHFKKPLFNTEYSHNDLPLVWAIGCAAETYLVAAKKTRHPLSAFFVIVLFTFLVTISGARKAQLLIFAIYLIYPIVISGDKKAYLTKSISILLVLLLFYTAIANIDFLYNAFGYRFVDLVDGILSGSYAESSAHSRDAMNDFAWEMIQKRPLTGYGLGTFATYSVYGIWSENTYTELWFSGGVMAPIIYVSVYVLLLHDVINPKFDIKLSAIIAILAIWYILISYVGVFYSDRLTELVTATIAFICKNQSTATSALEGR